MEFQSKLCRTHIRSTWSSILNVNPYLPMASTVRKLHKSLSEISSVYFFSANQSDEKVSLTV